MFDIPPKAVAARLQLGWCYFRLGKYQEAIGEFKRLQRDFPQSKEVEESLLKIGDSYYNLGEYAQALGAYSEKITEPKEIVPAIKRALEINRGGRTVLLEFITKEEGDYSKFQFR